MSDTFEGEIIDFHWPTEKSISMEVSLGYLEPDLIDMLFGTDTRTIEDEIVMKEITE